MFPKIVTVRATLVYEDEGGYTHERSFDGHGVDLNDALKELGEYVENLEDEHEDWTLIDQSYRLV